MKSQIHTVLGASGATGQAVIRKLQNRNLPFNAVERSKKKVEGVETLNADLLNQNKAIKAIQNSA